MEDDLRRNDEAVMQPRLARLAEVSFCSLGHVKAAQVMTNRRDASNRSRLTYTVITGSVYFDR